MSNEKEIADLVQLHDVDLVTIKKHWIEVGYNAGYERARKDITVKNNMLPSMTNPTICEINGYRWLLVHVSERALPWKEAVDWCTWFGGEMPPIDVLLQAYLNKDIKLRLNPAPYWSSNEFNNHIAWTIQLCSGHTDHVKKHHPNDFIVVKKIKL